MLTFTLILEHSWNTRPFCPLGAEHLCTQGRRMFSSRTLWGFLSHQLHEEGPLHVMFVETNHTQEQKKQKVCDWNHLLLSVTVPATATSRRGRVLNLTQSHFAAQTKTFEHEDQNATKIPSALTDSCIQFPWPVMSLSVRTLCLCLVLMTILFQWSTFPFLPALRPCHHQNRLVFAEWTGGHGILLSALKTIAMKLWRSPGTTSTWCLMRRKLQQEKPTKAPDNAGVDQSSMRGSKWYQESTREDDDHRSPPSSAVSDVITWTNRMSCQVREPIEHDEEKLAMKRGDMPPPLPERVDNPRIREAQAQMELYSNSDKIHHATLKTNSHKHGLIMADPSSRNLWGKQVHALNFITCQRTSAAFSTTKKGSFNRKSEFWRQENLNKPVATGEKFSVADLSQPREFWWKNYAHVFLTTEGWQLIDRRKTVAWGLSLWWDATQAEAMICQSTQELIPQDMFDSCGNQVKKKTRNLVKRQKE